MGKSRQDIRPLIQEGFNFFDQAEWKSCVEVLTRASEIQPDRFAPYFFLSLAYLALADKEKAGNFLRKGMEKSPENMLGKNIQAVMNLEERKIEEALSLLEEYGVVEHPRMQAFLLLEIEKLLSEFEE